VRCCPATPCPCASRTVSVTTDCEVPSLGNRSGDATIDTDSARPDGPDKGGMSCLSRPHAVTLSAATAAMTGAVRLLRDVTLDMLFMCLVRVREVCERHANRTDHGHSVIRLILAVETHVRNRVDDVAVDAEREERSFFLRRGPYDVELRLSLSVLRD